MKLLRNLDIYLQVNPEPQGSAPPTSVRFYSPALILQVHFMLGRIQLQFDPNYLVCLGGSVRNITARFELGGNSTDTFTFLTKFSLTTKISLLLAVVTIPRQEFWLRYGKPSCSYVQGYMSKLEDLCNKHD